MTVARRTGLRCAIGALVLGAALPAGAQTMYRLHDLGQLDGVGSFPTGINDNGQASGWLTDSTHTQRAVRSVDDVFQLVPGLETLAVEADGINQNGDLTGGITIAPFPGGIVHAFRFTDSGGLEDLGTLGGSQAFGTSINASGQLVGWSYNSLGGTNAFLANPGQAMTLVPLGYAGGINDAGQIVGYDGASPGPLHAYLYSSATGRVDLGAPNGYSAAQGINNVGQIAGTIGIPSHLHAARYSPGVGFEDIDPVASRNSQGWAINDHGDVVGSFGTSLFNHAFVFTAADGFVDLNTRIASGGEGWILVAANGINDAGEIVGTAQFGSQGPPRGFKLVPLDTVAPVITAASANPGVILDRNGGLVPVQISVTVTDNADPSPHCTVTAVSVSEPNSSGDAVITGPLTISVRAKRTGGAATGRVYTATIVCSDAEGNTATTSATVTVVHDSSGK